MRTPSQSRTVAVVALIAAAAALAVSLLVMAGSAKSDTYVNQLVARFQPHHVQVLADPGARPPLAQAERLNQQVLRTDRPIYVAAVAADQTGLATLDAVHAALSSRSGGRFSGVLLVIDSKGYHIGSYNVSTQIAGSADSLMKQSASDHRNDPTGAVAELVGKLGSLDFAATGSASSSANAPHHDYTVLWITIGIVLGVLVLIALVWLFVRGSSKRQQRQDELDRIDGDMIDLDPQVQQLAQAVLLGADVSNEHGIADQAMTDAKRARQRGDVVAARAHLKVARAQITKVERKLHPGATPRTEPDVAAVDAVAPAQRKQAHAKVQSPTGRTTVINNNDYRTSNTGGYNHYYGGGMYGGMYFYPGYYTSPFWTPGWSLTDVLIMDALLDDHWGGDYHSGYDSNAQSDTNFVGGGYVDDSSTSSAESDVDFDGDTDTGDYDTGSSGDDVSFDGDDSSSYNTGFDGGSDSSPSYSAPDPSPSYSAPDPTPSYSSSDYSGGGSDYGSSGGSDWGGGGDSGGYSGGGDSGF